MEFDKIVENESARSQPVEPIARSAHDASSTPKVAADFDIGVDDVSFLPARNTSQTDRNTVNDEVYLHSHSPPKTGLISGTAQLTAKRTQVNATSESDDDGEP